MEFTRTLFAVKKTTGTFSVLHEKVDDACLAGENITL